jgi:Protein of unknown function (DUF3097)
VDDRYGWDVLARDPHTLRRARSVELPAELGMVVEDAQTGYVGAVVRIEYGRMELEDRHGRTKPFPIGPGYLVDGKPVMALCWPHAGRADVAAAWRWPGRVRDWTDLDAALIGRVEELIDFVTQP